MTQKEANNNTELDTSIFRERFIRLREEHQMSQAQFAVFLGIPSGSVGGYENGTKFPNGKTLFTIATKCNVSADYLLGISSVPVVNEDMKMVCDYTGLDYSVLKILHNHSNNKQYMRFVESNILSTAIILDNEKE
jgi:transcriptional regulator with XRE-family HTH domain